MCNLAIKYPLHITDPLYFMTNLIVMKRELTISIMYYPRNIIVN